MEMPFFLVKEDLPSLCAEIELPQGRSGEKRPGERLVRRRTPSLKTTPLSPTPGTLHVDTKYGRDSWAGAKPLTNSLCLSQSP